MQQLAVNIRKLEKEDTAAFIELVNVFEVVFEMENFSIPSTPHLEMVLRNPHFGVFVAEVDGIVMGGLTTYTLPQYYTEKPLAYLYDLAISTQCQRQGIGEKLMTHASQYYQENGYEELFVQAESGDLQAVAFYRKTKPTGEIPVDHFYYKLT